MGAGPMGAREPACHRSVWLWSPALGIRGGHPALQTNFGGREKSEHPGLWKVPNLDRIRISGWILPSGPSACPGNPKIKALDGFRLNTGFYRFGPIFHNFGGREKSESPGLWKVPNLDRIPGFPMNCAVRPIGLSWTSEN